MNDKDKTKQQQEMDQATALLAESLPPMLFRMFANLKKEGFTEAQAMAIVLATTSAVLRVRPEGSSQ